MSDRGIHPRNLADLIENWDWDGEGTLGQQIQEAAESHNLTQARPRIIRTIAELEALDPETVVVCRRWSKYETVEDLLKYIYSDRNFAAALPAVVVIPAEQVRVARKALEEA